MTANTQLAVTMALSLACAAAGGLFGYGWGYHAGPVRHVAVRAPYVVGDSAEDGMTGEDLRELIAPKRGRVPA